MTISITKGILTINPVMVEYEVTTKTTTTVHELLDGTVDVTDGPDGLRSGTLKQMYSTEADALEAQEFHASGGVAALTISGHDLDMNYVRQGAMLLRRDPVLGIWWLEVGFQEVL